MDVQAARPPLISAAQPRRDVGKVLFHAAQDIGDFRAPLYGARAFFPLRAAAGDEQAADLLLLHAAHAAVPPCPAGRTPCPRRNGSGGRNARNFCRSAPIACLFSFLSVFIFNYKVHNGLCQANYSVIDYNGGMEKVSFGERLRECRAEKGLTQAQLARAPFRHAEYRREI